MPVFKLITAASQEDRTIGLKGQLPWKIKEDLQHFKRNTIHQTMVMGRKTFESLGSRPLPERETVVLSTQPRPMDLDPNVVWLNTYDAVLEYVKDEKTVWVVGGGEIYNLFLPVCDEMHITWVAHHGDGDAFFPDFDLNDYDFVSTAVLAREPLFAQVVVYQKKKA